MTKKRKQPRIIQPPITFPEKPSDGLPQTHLNLLYRAQLQGDFITVCRAIGKTLAYFDKVNFTSIDAEGLSRINDFVGAVFALFSNPTFLIPDCETYNLVIRAHIFANLVALSSYKTTDAVLEHVSKQKNNFIKLLVLYSARNKFKLPIKQLFDANVKWASLWYFTFLLPSISCPTKLLQENCYQHLAGMDERWNPEDRGVTPLYFTCTYFNNDADRRVKEIINKNCQRTVIKVKNTPKRDSIAIVTAKWFANSAVHKSCSPLIERLRKNYRLTLIHVGHRRPENLITELFDKVHYLEFTQAGHLDTISIEKNDFQLVYFPDVGMNNESVWLSNIRWAPIQVTSYGHPVSTFGSKIDYFIGGQDAEVIEDAEKNYSERLVLIPGIGAHPSWPNYVRKYPKYVGDKVRINCVWGPDKFDYTLLAQLQEISKQATVDHEFHFFCSQGVNRYNAFIPFSQDIHNLLGNRAVIHADKEYMDYMEAAEPHDFAINSHPFGGYNTVVESFYLSIPVVTQEGDKFYNKAAACLLRKVGLSELIANDAEDFIRINVRMLNDSVYRSSMWEHLVTMDLKSVLFDTDEPVYFEKAIEHLIDNHGQLTGRNPIIIT